MECLLIDLGAYFIQHMVSFNYGKIRTMGAVLVAISIPIFTSQLEKSKAATDAANIRAGYAEVSSQIILNDTTTTKTYYLQADGSVSEAKTNLYACKGAAAKLSDTTTTIGSTAATAIAWTTGSNIAYTYNTDTNIVTISVVQ